MPNVSTAVNDAAGIYLSQEIPLARFEALTRFPIVIYYGDYISKDNPYWASQHWNERVEMAKAFAECVNRHGGDASVVVLPEQGIYGNSHFAFAEKNNLQIADLMERWLVEKGLK